MKNTPNSPKIESGLIQMIMMEKSIRQMWVRIIFHQTVIQATNVWYSC